MLVRLQQEDRIVKLHDWEQVEEEEILYVVMEKGDTDLASLIKKYLTNKELTPAMIKVGRAMRAYSNCFTLVHVVLVFLLGFIPTYLPESCFLFSITGTRCCWLSP